MKYLTKPPADAFLSTESSNYYQQYSTYSEYNYLRPGLSSWIKSRHFELALRLTKPFFGTSNVIDFGCADGFFLPSLSKHFPHVCAIDKSPVFAKAASQLAQQLCLENVEVLCNEDSSIYDLRQHMKNRKWRILYLLEVLEHVGDREQLYESKIAFLKELSSLLDEEGMIVISVPNMVGFTFLAQRVGLSWTGQYREPISWADFLRASLLKDTARLEENWTGEHLGFNHRRLEDEMGRSFHVLRQKSTMFQVLYVVQAKKHDGRGYAL